MARLSTCSCRPMTKPRPAWKRRAWAWRAAASPTPPAVLSCGRRSMAGSMAKARCCATRASGISPSPIRKPPPTARQPSRRCRPWGCSAASRQIRAGREDRPGFPVRADRQCRAGFRRTLHVEGRPAGQRFGLGHPGRPAPAHSPGCRSAQPCQRQSRCPRPARLPAQFGRPPERSRPTATTCTKSTNNTNQSRNKFGTRPGAELPAVRTSARLAAYDEDNCLLQGNSPLLRDSKNV